MGWVSGHPRRLRNGRTIWVRTYRRNSGGASSGGLSAVLAVVGLIAVLGIGGVGFSSLLGGLSAPSSGVSVVPVAVTVSGADRYGFTSYPGARCVGPNEAVVVQRTTRSRLVVCADSSGALYYRGVRMKDGASIQVNYVQVVSPGYDAVNSATGTLYEVRPRGLTIRDGGKVLDFEQAVEYWAR